MLLFYVYRLNNTNNTTNITNNKENTMAFVTVVSTKQNELSKLVLPSKISHFEISNIVNISVKQMFKLLINNKNIHKLIINGVLTSKKWHNKFCDLLTSHNLKHVDNNKQTM
jgi:hypothetical protein